MKEIKVAKLDKEDQDIFEELLKEVHNLQISEVQLRSAQDAWRRSLKAKYDLQPEHSHYLKDMTIYYQEV